MSHSKGELTADKQIQYLIQWFVEFSSFQRQDFLNDHLEPIYLGFFQKCSHIESKPAQNGEGTSPTEINDLNDEHNSDEMEGADSAEAESLANGLNDLVVSSSRPPSIFECRMKLFKQWFNDQWNDQDRVKFLLGLKNVDKDFVSQLCQLLVGKDQIVMDHENVARIIDPEKSTESDRKNLAELLNTFNDAREPSVNSTSDLIETNEPPPTQQQQQKNIPDLLANCQNHQPTETDEDEEEEMQLLNNVPNETRTLESSLQNEFESQNDENQPPEI